MVEYVPRALSPRASRGKQQKIGRVAGVNDVKAALTRQPAHELADPPHRLTVFT